MICKRQQHIQNPKIGDLLEWVELLLRHFFEGMRFALENTVQVEFGLHDGLVEEAVRMGNELADLTADQVVEQRERGVDHQQGSQDVVQHHHVAEAEDAKHVRAVDDQAGEQQQDDGEGLQPVPEALVHGVHVDLLQLWFGRAIFAGWSRSASLPCAEHRAEHAHKEQPPSQSIQDTRS